MKRIVCIASMMIFLSSAAVSGGEEFPIICELKEVLNFTRPVQVIFLRIDMKNKTVNGITGTVIEDDIITYETDSESLTIIMPTMSITVIRKGKGPDGSAVRYTGVCVHDKLIY